MTLKAHFLHVVHRLSHPNHLMCLLKYIAETTILGVCFFKVLQVIPVHTGFENNCFFVLSL